MNDVQPLTQTWDKYIKMGSFSKNQEVTYRDIPDSTVLVDSHLQSVDFWSSFFADFLLPTVDWRLFTGDFLLATADWRLLTANF